MDFLSADKGPRHIYSVQGRYYDGHTPENRQDYPETEDSSSPVDGCQGKMRHGKTSLLEWKPSRPILRGVPDTKHMHLVADDFVNRDIGPWGKDQLAGVLGQAYPSDVRKLPQSGDALIDGLRHTAGRGGVIFADVLDDMCQVSAGRGRPPDSHQD
jgi:hypothetical protein